MPKVTVDGVGHAGASGVKPRTATPLSKLSIGFYLLGALLVFSGLPEAHAIWTQHRQLLGFAALLPALGVILFGGVVQILSDIRWHLLSADGDDDA